MTDSGSGGARASAPPSEQAADFSIEGAGPFRAGRTLRCAGTWVVLCLGPLEKKLTALAKSGEAIGAIDISGITRLDTAGALLLQRLGRQLGGKAGPLSLATDNEEHKRLLEATAKSAEAGEPSPPRAHGPFAQFLNKLGKSLFDEARQGRELLSFFGHFLVNQAYVLTHPRSLRVTALVYHMEQVGLAAVPIVALLSFLIGLVIAYMGAQLLAQFGASVYVVNLVEMAILRELGVLLTAIIVAGRSGSSFTAEIGAMQANEEVDAMRSMGLDPMIMLVQPRCLALFLMLPALVFLADIMGIFGGAVAASMSMDLSFGGFARRLQMTINSNHFWVGMIKAPFFAVIIGIVGCFQGFRATGSADSVGRLTTQSVVESIFLVIVLDAVFAVFFTTLRF